METAETKVGRRNGEKEQFWRGLFAEHGASGKTVVEFCLEKGLNASSFYGWRRKLRSRDGGKTTEEGFVELVRGGGAGSAGVSIRVSERIIGPQGQPFGEQLALHSSHNAVPTRPYLLSKGLTLCPHKHYHTPPDHRKRLLSRF